jgi:transaldolase
MQIFIDTAEVSEIRTAADWGIIDGVTTNPTLISKSGKDFKSVLNEIVSLVDGPISAEVVSMDAEGMLKEADVLAAMHRNIVIKLPLTPAGLKVCGILTKKGIKTNVTLCFQAGQALLAAKAGATYISPFIGRLDDVSEDGMQLIRDIRTIYDNYDFNTQILAASIRHPRHIIESAMAGADVVTSPMKVIQQLYQHPLTEKGLASFMEDWKKSGQKSIVG